MTTFYNQIAGQSVHRLSGLVDAVFAIDMTLLVLDLRVPVGEAIHSEGEVWAALVALAPRFVTYLMSFLTLGIFWIGQETTSQMMARADRHASWITICFLMAVSLIPFSTAFLAEFITSAVALVVYWVNILLIGITLLAGWYYVKGHGLLKEDVPSHVYEAVRRRILVGQGLYALGAAMAVFDPRISIGFIVLVQLMFAISPRPFDRL
jgi:uncharacterized membrane protein